MSSLTSDIVYVHQTCVNTDSILNYRSAILAVNVTGGMLEPEKINLFQLCTYHSGKLESPISSFFLPFWPVREDRSVNRWNGT